MEHLSKEQLEEIISKYNRGEDTGYSDEEYDILLEDYLKRNGGESNRPYNRNKQSDSVNEITGTLPKLFGITTPLRPGLKTYEEWVKTNDLGTDVMIQAKFDGCSVAYDFETGRFFTRGDFDNGESLDVTDLFKTHIKMFKWYAFQKTSVMKFEAIMSHEIFYDDQYPFKEKYKKGGPRAAVAAIINSHDVELSKFITLIPLRAFMNKQSYIPNALIGHGLSLFTHPTDFEGMENFIKDKLSAGATVKFNNQTYSIDGIVISKLINFAPNHPLYNDPNKEIAVKILSNIKETKLISINFNFGKQGRITPVAILEPVKFENGITVDHVTLSTLERVIDMNLCVNDTVTIMHNIVPYFIGSYHDGTVPIQVPRKCPICGSELDYHSYKQVRCSNPDCRGLKLGAIVRYAEKMKMFGISKGIITKLYDEGVVTSIKDLYTLESKKDVISNMDGFGLLSWGNMVTSVKASMSELKPAKFLGALPINDTSESTWENIILVMGPDIMTSLMNDTFVEKVMNLGYIPNVGELKLRKIIDGVLRHKDEIKSLIEILNPYFIWDQKYSKGKVAMTGTRDANITKLLEDNGYTVGSFTNDCIALIVPDMQFTSAKTIKAHELHIPIIQLSDVERMIINESL
jgi:DNA ligase (NAD+)